jgi:gamma-glutamyltranspeptidase/glutathione hydrolase
MLSTRRRTTVWLLFTAAALTLTGTALAQRTMRPVIRGSNYAVSSRKPQATQAAERILRAGGNAFDAAVAGQAALCVTDPASNGVGGDAFILVYDAKEKKVYSVNAGGYSPRLATIEWYRKNNHGEIPENDSLLSATVPTSVDAWYTVLSRWGTMSFAEVLEPTIELADGFPISELLARSIASRDGARTFVVGDGIKTEVATPKGNRKLRKYPTSKRIYFPNGRAPAAGEVFANPDLARTLRKLVEAEDKAADKGRQAALKAARDRFYKGDIARTMAKFSEENGGLFRYDDFADYSVKVEDPVSIDYRGYEVYKNPSANQGPSELFTLNILRGFDLRSMGHNSADYIHTFVESLKLAFADREMYLADMDFVKIPFPKLLTESYGARRRALIDSKKASLAFRPGNPDGDAAGSNQPKFRIPVSVDADHEGDTSYVAVIDKDRNAVSWTPSLHSGWGSGIVIGDLGFMFNCRGDYFWLQEGHPNALLPRKRPRSTLTPTMILKDGKPFMAVGSPGGDDQCMRIMQTFLNVVEFDMNIQAAIEAPRATTSSFPSSVFPHAMAPGKVGLESRVSPEVIEELRKRGHRVDIRGAWSMNATSAIVVDPETGVLSAGADIRGDNYALAW